MNLLVPLRLSQVIALTGALATLVVNPWSNYDPISLPKMVVMSGGAISAAAFLIFNQVTFFATVDRSTKFAFSVFLIGLMVPMLFSGAPLAQQFWGSFGRNTGLLTYLSLASLMFATLVLRSTTAYSIILRLFIGTAAPMTAYCLVQYFHKDPISWSEKFVFGTLGNVNFLSAFICMTSVAFILLGNQ